MQELYSYSGCWIQGAKKINVQRFYPFLIADDFIKVKPTKKS